MLTDRETILSTLFTAFEVNLTVAALRNEVLPTRIPATGLVIMRDGDPGEPVEVTMSPIRYHYEHRVEMEVFFEAATARDAGFDWIAAQIGQVVIADRTLGGLCDWIETGAPELDDLALAGAETLKAGIVPLILHYAVADPLT